MTPTLDDLKRDLAAGAPATWGLESALKLAGIGRTNGQARARRGELPFPVWKVGRVYRVPLLPFARALGLDLPERPA